jgi:hypothetical protein
MNCIEDVLEAANNRFEETVAEALEELLNLRGTSATVTLTLHMQETDGILNFEIKSSFDIANAVMGIC